MKTWLPLTVMLAVSVGCGRIAGPSQTAASGSRFAIIAPASASADLGRMFSEAGAAEWATARSRLRGFQFYQQSLRPSCPTCGPNNINTLLNATPGGAFAWLTRQGIQVGVEAGAVKEHTCDGRALAHVLMTDIAPIYASGAHVVFVAMDEPFTAALPLREGGVQHRCDFTIDRTVIEVKAFIQTLNAAYPAIRIGLIEAYPYFSAEGIIGLVGALRNAGVQLPFFRLDFDLRHRASSNINASSDMRRMRTALAQMGTEFEVIVTGYDGKTDASSVGSAMALAYEIDGAVGMPYAIAFQDWSADRLGVSTSALNLPENRAGSLTWLVNSGSEVFR